MWVRFGRWMEMGVHFGMQHTNVDVVDRYLVHASLRFGKHQWNYGPDRPLEPMNAALGTEPTPRTDLHTDPEPLRWGVRKVGNASNYPEVDTRRPIF